jgi:hypothetical protein
MARSLQLNAGKEQNPDRFLSKFSLSNEKSLCKEAVMILA